MKQLGNLVLPDSLQWIDQWEGALVQQESARTLGGRLVIWSRPLPDGRLVTLVAEEEVTWLSLADLQAIRQMAAEADASFPLVWEDDTMTVRFRHDDPPAIAFRPIWPHHARFTGSIKLIQV